MEDEMDREGEDTKSVEQDAKVDMARPPRGRDPEGVFKDIAEDLREMEKLGFVFERSRRL